MPANKIPLASLNIDKPCSQNWQSMPGDDRRRFCAQCQHSVHNLSALTERQIQKLLRATEGRLCGRLTHDHFGRLITQPERGPRGWLQRKTGTLKLALSSALAVLIAVPVRGDQPAPKTAPTQSSTEKSVTPASAPAKDQTPAKTPSSAQATTSDEPITFELMGVMFCVQPKPPVRKKYKK